MKIMTFLLLLSLPVLAQESKNTVVEILTSKSPRPIEIELNDKLAPVTVKNFLSYVDSKFYDGTIFHRVIPSFMAQGGGFTEGMKEKPTKAPIKNEATNGLKNERGTIAMARTMEPHSATAQFFINVVNNDFLNHQGTSSDKYGYAVFGKVVKGMDIVDEIVKVRTGTLNGHQNVPMDSVTIKSIRRKK